MTPDEKAELRKVAEAPQAGVIYRTIGADLAMMVRCKHVLALLDENARLAAEVDGLTTRLHQHEGHYDAQGLLK
jgi:hypothetical protein